MVTISDIDAYQAGTGGADFTLPIVNAARNAVCGIFQQYPGALIPGPVDDFVNGVYSGLCKNSTPGLPPAPTSPFTGGQCFINYQISYTYTVTNNASGGAVDLNSSFQDYGPITEIATYQPAPGEDPTRLVIIKCHDASGNPTTVYDGVGGSSNSRNLRDIVITPLYGIPDTCGNPPPAYPPASIPSGGTSIATTVPVPGGGTFGAITSLILPALAIAAFPEFELAPLQIGRAHV